MREQLEDLVNQHGYVAVLHELECLAGKSIHPNEIGYAIVFEKSVPLRDFFIQLDRGKTRG